MSSPPIGGELIPIPAGDVILSNAKDLRFCQAAPQAHPNSDLTVEAGFSLTGIAQLE